MVLGRLALLFWIPVLWMPAILAGCVHVASTNPACPDCGDTSQAGPFSTPGETDSSASVENPIRSLNNVLPSHPSPGESDQSTANNAVPETGDRGEPAPRGLTDAEVGELIEGVVIASDVLEDAGLVAGDPAPLPGLGLVDRWGFPLFGQTGADALLDLFIDGLSFGILPPDRSGGDDDSSDFTILERQCIAQGEPEFICRQRYGR